MREILVKSNRGKHLPTYSSHRANEASNIYRVEADPLERRDPIQDDSSRPVLLRGRLQSLFHSDEHVLEVFWCAWHDRRTVDEDEGAGLDLVIEVEPLIRQINTIIAHNLESALALRKQRAFHLDRAPFMQIKTHRVSGNLNDDTSVWCSTKSAEALGSSVRRRDSRAVSTLSRCAILQVEELGYLVVRVQRKVACKAYPRPQVLRYHNILYSLL